MWVPKVESLHPRATGEIRLVKGRLVSGTLILLMARVGSYGAARVTCNPNGHVGAAQRQISGTVTRDTPHRDQSALTTAWQRGQVSAECGARHLARSQSQAGHLGDGTSLLVIARSLFTPSENQRYIRPICPHSAFPLYIFLGYVAVSIFPHIEIF